LGSGSGSVSVPISISGTVVVIVVDAGEACLSDKRYGLVASGIVSLSESDSGYADADCRLQFSMHNQQQQHFAT